MKLGAFGEFNKSKKYNILFLIYILFVQYHYLVEHLLFWRVITIAPYYNMATPGTL
jgi:hypothetical protein